MVSLSPLLRLFLLLFHRTCLKKCQGERGRRVLPFRFGGRQFHHRHLPANRSPRKTGLYLVRRCSTGPGNRRHTGLPRPGCGHGSCPDPRMAEGSRATCAGGRGLVIPVRCAGLATLLLPSRLVTHCSNSGLQAADQRLSRR